MSGRRANPRCQWCIQGDHSDCYVIQECGLRNTNSSFKYGDLFPKQKKVQPYLFRCGCDCLWAQGTKCLRCLRRSVVVDRTSRCVDVEECSMVVPVGQPKVREVSEA